ncbi:MAG: nucleoside-diphosphate-sugar epimerase [Akkermansiaceae bacterium]|nr:nucleoside-diphosphate-sugar epimerase [Akkermansiaceae bacterium]
MSQTLQILIVSDGKPGHENQSMGLAEALGRLTPVKVVRTSLAGATGLFRRLGAAWEGSRNGTQPDLIIGAGHATHPSLIFLARKYEVPSILLMKPSLPAMLFDLCLVPVHDLKGVTMPENFIPTLGALNRVSPVGDIPKSGRMILIGGPSASHGWNEGEVQAMVKSLVDGPGWEATDSRRTPPETLPALATACSDLHIHPHAATGPGWLPGRLAAAEEVWVTEDSVSMIYEALSSGARVGILPVPVRKENSRVVRGIRKLAEDGYVTRFSNHPSGTPLPAPKETLREADRCAKIVMERFFPDLSLS